MADNSSSYVDNILAAETLYEVLGVPRDIDGTDNTLRRAYLKQSVKVHPDKNNDPRATQAFQRVAEAWSTLSEPSSKADYDRYLRYGSGGNQHRGGGQQQQQQQQQSNNSGYGHQETYYASETGHNTSPSFQEALFMFATMTSMFSGGSGSKARFVGDMAQTLMWAQQLAEGRKQQQQQQQQRGFDPNNNDGGHHDNDNNMNNNNGNNNMNDMQNKAATGFMLGGGLRAVAGAQHMLGFKKSAAAMEKAATAVEVAAVGSALADTMKDNPMVKKAIERGQNAMKDPKVANALRGSLRFAGELAKSYREASSTPSSNNNNTNNINNQQQYHFQR